MRDCVFLVADGHMHAVLATFLSLDRFFQKLGTAPFSFHAERDLVVPEKGRNDPNVYLQAHVILRGYLATHRHAVVMLDEAWEHRRQPEEIVGHIRRNLVQSGWREGQFEIVLIRPELEVWIWQDNPHVQRAFYRRLSAAERARLPPLRTWLRDQGLWPEGQPKPSDPKAAVLRARAQFRAGSQTSIYVEICRSVSLQGCQDPAFHQLRDALRRWFPAPGVTP